MILSINTATEYVSIAIYDQNKNISQEISWESYRTQSKELLPKIDKLLNKNNFKLSDLSAIAVNIGPGSYTGLRVGVSVANSLAWSLDIPIIGSKNSDNLSENISALEIAENASKLKRSNNFSKFVLPIYKNTL